MAHDLLRFLTCGSVDDGKSTLIGRLLMDAGLVLDDQLAALATDSRRHGTLGQEMDPALLTDGLKAEREQGITIDVAYRYFSTARRSFIIADTPGHEQYTRNMVSGASTCDLAILLVDATHGLKAQTRRHAAIAALLGIRHLVLAINKMDLVEYRQDTYDAICADFQDFARKLSAVDVQCLPLAARTGDNVVFRSSAMPWFQGSTMLHLLETVQIATGKNTIDLRLPIQVVCRPDAGFRGYQGSIRSGSLRVGDEVVVVPSGVATSVKSIVGTTGPVTTASAPDAVTVELASEVDVSRGDLIVHSRNQPRVSHHIEAMVVWMGEMPLATGGRYLIKHLTATGGATLLGVDYRLNVDDLRRVPAAQLAMNEFGRCQFECDRPIPWDPYERNRATGAFVVIDRVSLDTVGAGMVIDRLPGSSERPPTGAVAARTQPMTVWLTGLSGAGKSSIAQVVERTLLERGARCITLDGDLLRTGLNSDLGFSADDRRENVRRVAEVAKLFTAEGYVVLVPVIAPFAADRDRARDIVGRERFRLVWVDAPLEVCETRDVKGLYKKARRGDLPEFTGVSSPYQPPESADLVVRTSELSLEDAAAQVLALVEVRR
jgi:bifunctional enzyme CysN/CysC